MPNMPNGKPAGIMCTNLDPITLSCLIWGQENYPKHCKHFIATLDVCGNSREQALQLIDAMELATKPHRTH